MYFIINCKLISYCYSIIKNSFRVIKLLGNFINQLQLETCIYACCLKLLLNQQKSVIKFLREWYTFWIVLIIKQNLRKFSMLIWKIRGFTSQIKLHSLMIDFKNTCMERHSNLEKMKIIMVKYQYYEFIQSHKKLKSNDTYSISM